MNKIWAFLLLPSLGWTRPIKLHFFCFLNNTRNICNLLLEPMCSVLASCATCVRMRMPQVAPKSEKAVLWLSCSDLIKSQCSVASTLQKPSPFLHPSLASCWDNNRLITESGLYHKMTFCVIPHALANLHANVSIFIIYDPIKIYTLINNLLFLVQSVQELGREYWGSLKQISFQTLHSQKWWFRRKKQSLGKFRRHNFNVCLTNIHLFWPQLTANCFPVSNYAVVMCTPFFSTCGFWHSRHCPVDFECNKRQMPRVLFCSPRSQGDAFFAETKRSKERKI